MTLQSVPGQLADEFRRVGLGPNAQPVATFTVRAMEAYTLTAALQACSRHPGLSDDQREIVLGFAHQVADQLVTIVRAVLGTKESAIETTIGMGFDPQFDVADRDPDPEDFETWDDGDRCVVCGCTDDRACPSGCEWIAPSLCSTTDEAHAAYRLEHTPMAYFFAQLETLTRPRKASA